MAAIDKTYVNKAQLFEAIEWCKQIGEVTLENGYKFKPLDFVTYYQDGCIDELEEGKQYMLWNTPTWFDRWLWNNCPLDFVTNRIADVYGQEMLYMFRTWKYRPKKKIKQKYTFLETPQRRYWKWVAGKGHPYFNARASVAIDVELPNKMCYEYDLQTDTWGEPFGVLPYGDYYYWNDHHKRIPNKKSIIRQLRKWNFPKGSIVHVYCINYEIDFKILVK